VRILIDACLPVELKSLLEGTEVKTARDMGWQRLDNGSLLKAAAARHFDVLVTMDKSMPSQQLLERYPLAVVVVKALSNRLADLTPLAPRLQVAIDNAPRGRATAVE